MSASGLLYFFYQALAKIYGHTLVNELHSGTERCPIPVKNEPVLSPPNDFELSKGTLPFFISVVNYVASIVNAGLNKQKYINLKGMTTLKDIGIDKDPALTVISSIDTDPSTLVIGIRGTQTSRELAEDTHMKQLPFKYGGKVHQGFLEVYNKIIQDVINTIPLDTKNIICSGHSLGSAISVLIAVTIAYTFPNVTITVVNCACPRVGDKEFSDNANDILDRHITFRNDSDGIPNMPPAVLLNLQNPADPWLYYRSGKEIIYNDNWKSGSNNHNIANYLNFIINFIPYSRFIYV